MLGSTATRPDAIEEDVLDYLEKLNKRTFLIIELAFKQYTIILLN